MIVHERVFRSILRLPCEFARYRIIKGDLLLYFVKQAYLIWEEKLEMLRTMKWKFQMTFQDRLVLWIVCSLGIMLQSSYVLQLDTCSGHKHSSAPPAGKGIVAYATEKETSECFIMLEGEHCNAFFSWLFRKHWEGWWKGSDGGHRSRVSSQQVNGGLPGALAHTVRQVLGGSAGFQSSYLLTVGSSCAYSMFFCSVNELRWREHLTPLRSSCL